MTIGVLWCGKGGINNVAGFCPLCKAWDLGHGWDVTERRQLLIAKKKVASPFYDTRMDTRVLSFWTVRCHEILGVMTKGRHLSSRRISSHVLRLIERVWDELRRIKKKKKKEGIDICSLGWVCVFFRFTHFVIFLLMIGRSNGSWLELKIPSKRTDGSKVWFHCVIIDACSTWKWRLFDFRVTKYLECLSNRTWLRLKSCCQTKDTTSRIKNYVVISIILMSLPWNLPSNLPVSYCCKSGVCRRLLAINHYPFSQVLYCVILYLMFRIYSDFAWAFFFLVVLKCP